MQTRYDEMKLKAVGLAFILAPVLLLAAAMAFVFDFGRNPNGLDSYVEGIIGFYAFILFVPVWVTLAGLIGEQRPRLGIVLAVLGLFTAAAGVLPMSTRVIQESLTRVGIDQNLWDFFETTPVVFLVPAASIFGLVGAAIGVVLLRTRQVQPYAATLLVAAVVPFYLAQAGEVSVSVTWTLAALCYVVALAPMGWRLISEGRLHSAPQGAERLATT